MPKLVSAGQRSFRPPSNSPASRSPEASPATIARRGAVTSLIGSSWRLAHQAARRCGEEIQHDLNVLVGALPAQGLEVFLRLLQRGPAPEDQLVHLADDPLTLVAEPAALETGEVDGAYGQGRAVHCHER